MAGNNGKGMSIVQRDHTAELARWDIEDFLQEVYEAQLQPFHWAGVNRDVLIRPRTTDENAAAVDEGNAITRAIEEYQGTADEPGAIEGYRLRLRFTVPCVLNPATKLPIFTVDQVDRLLAGLPTPAINEILDEVDLISNFTSAQAEEAGKNSEETDDGSASSVSPSAAETPASSPIPAS